MGRAKVYESNTERQRAYRERLKAKLMNVINSDTPEVIPPSEVPSYIDQSSSIPPIEPIPSTTRPAAKSYSSEQADCERISVTPEPIESKSASNLTAVKKSIKAGCEFCGAFLSWEQAQQGQRCSFCKQFSNREERDYAVKLRRRMVITSKTNRQINDELERLYEEKMKQYRSEH